MRLICESLQYYKKNQEKVAEKARERIKRLREKHKLQSETVLPKKETPVKRERPKSVPGKWKGKEKRKEKN